MKEGPVWSPEILNELMSARPSKGDFFHDYSTSASTSAVTADSLSMATLMRAAEAVKGVAGHGRESKFTHLDSTSSKHAMESAMDTMESTSWCTSSVRWIEENYPEHSRIPLSRSSKGSREILLTALASMSYFEAARERGEIVDAASARERAVRSWNRDSHSRMVEFLKSGGYVAAAKIKPEDTARWTADAKAPEHDSVADQAPASVPTSDESMEDVIMFASPSAGSW